MGLLLKGARLIDPQVDLDECADILVRDGAIAQVGHDLTLPKGETVDCRGLIAVPGLVDMHVHLREPGYEYKETIATGARAAAHGGFTDICCMPNTNPVADDAAVIEAIVKKAAEQGACRVHPFGAMTRGLAGADLTEVGDMRAHGAVGLSDDGRGVQSAGMMRRVMDYAKMFDLPLSAHSEDESLAGTGCVNEGAISTRLGLPGQPAQAESIPIARDIALSELTGCPVHFAHVSCRQSVEAIRAAKARGIAVTAEATPHHLILDEEALTSAYDTNLKMNPPLRTAADREALRAALADGTIDCIASDHAPHAPHEKDVEFERAAYGTTGLETSLSLVLTELVRPGLLNYADLVRLMAINPRAVLHLPPVSIAVGSSADLTLIAPDESYIVEPSEHLSRGRNCAFSGRTMTGRAQDVLIGGYFTMRDGKVMA